MATTSIAQHAPLFVSEAEPSTSIARVEETTTTIGRHAIRKAGRVVIKVRKG
jgi:hypothetical protein